MTFPMIFQVLGKCTCRGDPPQDSWSWGGPPKTLGTQDQDCSNPRPRPIVGRCCFLLEFRFSDSPGYLKISKICSALRAPVMKFPIGISLS